MNSGNEGTVQAQGAPSSNATSRGLPNGNEQTRHSSPFLSPSLRSSVASNRSGESTPPSHRVTIESLMRRPRSNQRTRTPMRYESPLDPDAFRRGEPSPERTEGQRITVQTLAGSAVGTTLGTRRLTEGRPVTPLSSKQGPSRRKVRRWNNDNFSAIASELAKASAQGAVAAEVITKAQADSSLYISVYNPNDFADSAVAKFMVSDDTQLKAIRNEFFEGEIGTTEPSSRSHIKRAARRGEPTPGQMLNDVPERLRNVLIRACSSSKATTKIVDAYEDFLVQTFAEGKDDAPINEAVSGSLLARPTVTKVKSGSTIARFRFDAESSQGGFHRLLLHAICRFHNLNTVSTTVDSEESGSPARLLTVTGTTVNGSQVRLSRVLQEEKKRHSITSSNMGQLNSSLSSLRV